MEAFEVKLNGAVGGQIWWVANLIVAGELELDDL